jgi:hypothetical protein
MPHLSQKRNLQNPVAPASSSPRGVWQLPGGQTLAEFALRTGILAPQLLSASRSSRQPAEKPAGSSPAASSRETSLPNGRVR